VLGSHDPRAGGDERGFEVARALSAVGRVLIGGLVGPTLSVIDEQLGHLTHELLLPSRHLARVDAELLTSWAVVRSPRAAARATLALKAAPKTRRFPPIVMLQKRVPLTLRAPPYPRARKSGSTSRLASGTPPEPSRSPPAERAAWRASEPMDNLNHKP